jgi:hypothetical protein
VHRKYLGRAATEATVVDPHSSSAVKGAGVRRYSETTNKATKNGSEMHVNGSEFLEPPSKPNARNSMLPTVRAAAATEATGFDGDASSAFNGAVASESINNTPKHGTRK